MNTEREKLTELVERYKAAVKTQNREDFEALWTGRKTDTLISIATKFEGVDSIYRDFLIGRIQKAYESIELIGEEPEIHFISDNTAVIIFSYRTECVLRESGEKFGIKGLETQVAIKTDSSWRLSHIHYSKV